GVMVDTVHGRIASEFTLTGGPITQVAAGPQAAMLAFVNRHGSVSLWNTAHASNVCTFELSSTQTVNQLVFAPNARWLMAAGAGGLLRLWDVLERKEIKAWRDKTNQIAAVLFSPDSATVACGHISGRIRLWEPASARL